MIILASDTALENASCALVKDNKVIKELIVSNDKKHATNFMPMIEELFNLTEYNISDVDYFAMSSGPGSFTGLRIGISTIKAIAYALKKKVIMVPTLDILATQSYKKNSIMCPIIDARNQQVYTAIYNDDGQSDYMGIHIDELIEKVKKYKCDIVLSGNAAIMYLEYFKDKLDNNIVAFEKDIYPSSVTCASIALKYDKIEAKDAIPHYLRPSQAERLFKGNG